MLLTPNNRCNLFKKKICSVLMNRIQSTASAGRKKYADIAYILKNIYYVSVFAVADMSDMRIYMFIYGEYICIYRNQQVGRFYPNTNNANQSHFHKAQK